MDCYSNTLDDAVKMSMGWRSLIPMSPGSRVSPVGVAGWGRQPYLWRGVR